MSHKAWLGIDIGSISTNTVLIDSESGILYKSYIRGSGSPIGSVRKALSELSEKLDGETEIAGLCTTGSGREIIGAMLGADVVKNEISAHARAAIDCHPDVRTVIEIGGQDSKVTIIRDRAVVDFAMNLVCAAGTGSFLDSQARRLDMDIEEFSRMAMLSENPTAIAGRCTVFAESDMIHKQQLGHAQPDIIMGLCQALARNFLSNVCRGKDIEAPVLLQGGVSQNRGIRRAFSDELGFDVIVPENNMVMGALGAALIARDTAPEQSNFRGLEVGDHDLRTRAFTCSDCPDSCEIIEVLDGNDIIGRSGGRCGKWQGA